MLNITSTQHDTIKRWNDKFVRSGTICRLFKYSIDLYHIVLLLAGREHRKNWISAAVVVVTAAADDVGDFGEKHPFLCVSHLYHTKKTISI